MFYGHKKSGAQAPLFFCLQKGRSGAGFWNQARIPFVDPVAGKSGNNRFPGTGVQGGMNPNFSPSRRRSGLRRGVARNRMRTEAGKMPESLISPMRTEAGKMPESLISPIRNGHGVSNDRFGINRDLKQISGGAPRNAVNAVSWHARLSCFEELPCKMILRQFKTFFDRFECPFDIVVQPHREADQSFG